MRQNDLISLLNLLSIRGLGPGKINNLVSTFTSCESIFHLTVSELCSVDGIYINLAENILKFHNFDYGKREIETASRLKTDFVTFWDNNYPLLLQTIAYPPPVLYTKGSKLNERMDGVGIVGTRRPTHYGVSVVKRICIDIVKRGWSTVSGLARGIDTVVHSETVKNGGKTIAVLGNGLDRIYPPENSSLAYKIQERGTLVSEFSFGTKPDAVNFPMRNRIISGLSHGLAVIEAGTRSGAILTALNAVDQNREVFAVPGRLNDTQSVGCNRLIKNGAIPLLNEDVIYENIRHKLFKPAPATQTVLKLNISEVESDLLRHIDSDAVSIEELERKSGLNFQNLLKILLDLELKGVINQLNGGLYARV